MELQQKVMNAFIGKVVRKDLAFLVKGGLPVPTYVLEYLLGQYCASDDEEEQYPAPFEEDYGSGYPSAFCYVFNTENDWCSEFGDCFFEKRADGFYHRVS